jgi:hypothetical protein
LRRPGGSAQTAPVLLDAYLILYDMLNDDDEEIRDTATAVASWVLSYPSPCPGKIVALAPLAASAQLAEFIVRNYPNSPRLFCDAVRRLSNQEPHLNGIGGDRIFTHISNFMSKYNKESTVLFEEEKQNLFIDEVREIDIWARVLSRLDADAYDKSLANGLFKWVTEGLSYFIDTAISGNNSDGLLGWTSKPEIYILGVRLFRAAEVFLSDAFLCHYSCPEEAKDIITSRLQLLRKKGREICLHNQWLSRIESALSGSSIPGG